uniref:F-box domain-containing protein n=1 Tax=Oryza brachyantha TaxID=4533 RepID=J3N651_ORYBR
MAMDELIRAPACGGGGGGTVIEDLPGDVLALVLRRLDGASLAAVGCACSSLHELAADQETWRGLCLALWPSVRDVLGGGGENGCDESQILQRGITTNEHDDQ